MEIQFKIANQTLKRIGETYPANHSQEFLKLSFEFQTEDWEGLTKFALFNYQGKRYRIPLTNNACITPNAVLKGERFGFMVYGVNNEDVRATTNHITVYLAESGYSTDVENDIPDDDPGIVEQIYLDIDAAKSEAESNAKDYTDTALTGKSDVGHTHTESDITDLKEYSIVGHKHTKSDVTDFTHIHKEADITDLKSYALADHNHDSRYYTESEVDTIISNLRHDLLNRCNFTSDKQIIQTSEIADITAIIIENGIPKGNNTIYFYEKEEE